jgi:transcriptional regulator with XRE-family HTH domain
MRKADLARFLGRRLREIRLKKGLRQQDLQERGMSYKYYQRIEEGKVNPTLRSLEKLAFALGVSVFDFFQNPSRKKELLQKEKNKKAAKE